MVGLIRGKDRRLAFQALKYLTDRRDGRASQALSFENEGRVVKLIVDL